MTEKTENNNKGNTSLQKNVKPSSKDTTMKTAWICVPAINYTGEDKKTIVSYSRDQIKDILDLWAWESNLTYWFIQHNPDEDDINPHFHIAIKFRTNSRFSTIKGKFPYARIEPAKNIKRAIQYLVHLNHPEKLAYKWEDIITNGGDLSEYKTLSRSQQEVHLQRIFDSIDKGEITQANYEFTIPHDLYARHASSIKNALEFHRLKTISQLNNNSKLKVIYIYGNSRVGKSYYAWELASLYAPGEKPGESSNSNDPLQDYRGQKCFIWNDFRDSHMKFSDLLTFLDPHYRSSGKSRYYNKMFTGDLLIMTSTIRLDFLYKGCQDLSEDMKQFRARISEYHIVDKDKVEIFVYDEPTDDFYSFKKFKNIWYERVTTSSSSMLGSNFDPSIYQKLGVTLEDPSPEDSKVGLLKGKSALISDEDLYRLKKQEMDNLDLKGKCSIFLQDYPQYNIATVTAKAAAHEFVKQYPEVGLCHGNDYIINTMALCKQGCRNI